MATGITTAGDQEVLDLAVGHSQAETFWAEFLRVLRNRGLGGERRVKVPKASADMVAAALRTVFAHPDPTEVSSAWDRVADTFAAQFPKVTDLMNQAKADVLALSAFPFEHWRNLVYKSFGAGQKRDNATGGCRRHLPQRRCRCPPRRRRAGRTARRLGHTAPLVIRRLDGQNLPAARH